MQTARLRVLSVAAAPLMILVGCESAPKSDAHSEAQESRGKEVAATMNQGQAVGAPINTVCPIGGHGADEMIPVAYKGKTIGFCCGGCVDEFDTMNAEGKDQVLARAEKNVGPE